MHLMIDTIEERFNQVVALLAAMVAASIGLAALLIPLNLFLIKFQFGSMWWLFSSIEYGLYFGVFAAAPWVLQQGAHVRIDILSANLNESAGAKLEAFTNIFGAIVCLVLCFYGTRSGIWEFIDKTMPDKDLQIANWIIIAIFTLSFLLSATEFLMRLRHKRVLKLASDEPSNQAGL